MDRSTKKVDLPESKHRKDNEMKVASFLEVSIARLASSVRHTRSTQPYYWERSSEVFPVITGDQFALGEAV